MTIEPPTGGEHLRRELSRFAIAVLAINGIVGAGIFTMPGKAAAAVGAFSPVIFIVCGVLTSTLMISFAQAASYFRGTGGPVLYTEVAFGKFTGFQVGWILWVSRVLALAANANLLTKYAGLLCFGGDPPEPFRITLIVVLAIGFAAVNIAGVKTGMATITAITFAKFLPLLTLCLIGLSHVSADAFAGMEVPNREDFGKAVLLVFYAFVGFEGGLVPAGESKNPRRDIPRAMFATAAFASILYAWIQIVSYSAAPDLGESETPLATAGEAILPSFGATMISIGAIVSVLGNYASSVLSVPRITFALGRDGMLPAFFAAVHPRRGTPHLSIVVYCATGLVLGITGTFVELAIMSSFARLVVYILGVASLPFLRKRFGHNEDALRLPGGLLIPGIALTISLWLVMQVSFESIEKTVWIIGAGTVLFLLVVAGRWRSARTHSSD